MEIAKQNYSHDRIMNFSDSKDPINYDDDDVVDDEDDDLQNEHE